jgi:hypothetical protein
VAQVVLLRLAWLARLAFRADLGHAQLSQDLVDLLGEVVRQVLARVLVGHGGHVDQQPGVAPAHLDLGGLKQAEQDIPDYLADRERAYPPYVFAGVLRWPLGFMLSVPWARSAHDTEPPASSRGSTTLVTTQRCLPIWRSPMNPSFSQRPTPMHREPSRCRPLSI